MAAHIIEKLLKAAERALWGDRSNAPTTSYAQNGEDILLDRALKGQTTGFYIDIGANDPVSCSVTKLFYDRGFSGVNIEPGRVFARLARMRPRDTNLQIALSDHAGEATFYEYPEADGLSTMSVAVRDSLGQACVERKVAVSTLADVCRKHVTGEIDFLKVDVEGHEREVLLGGDWRRWRPRIVVVESPITDDGDGPHRDWEPLLLAADYLPAAFDGINRYYVRREDERLLACFRRPLNVLDHYIAYHQVRRYHELGPLALAAARILQRLIDVSCRWYPRRPRRAGT